MKSHKRYKPRGQGCKRRGESFAYVVNILVMSEVAVETITVGTMT